MKIAIIGSAPSSAHLAPYDDPEWTIWACSPGAVQVVRRVDAWFEIHRWGQDWQVKEYRGHLAGLSCPVYMIEKVPDVPSSVAYPKDRIVGRFGRSFFTSTPAWMIALAIDQGAEEIGFWGIDMASDDEYVLQKPGCHHFIEIARASGIRITVPPQSDLLQPPALYGFDEASPMMIKLLTRQAELLERINTAQANIDHFTREKIYLSGAEDNLRYVMNTWVR